MKWEQIREQYPEQWVLVEAISAFSKNSIRYLDEISVISNFPESTYAWKEYKKLHLADPTREYYIFHTQHKTIEVKEQKFIGVRDKGAGTLSLPLSNFLPCSSNKPLPPINT